MATGYEVRMYQDISNIARHLGRIADCLEADQRQKEEVMYLEGECTFADCPEPVVMMLNGERFCQNHIDQGFAMMQPAWKAVMRGMTDLEQATREEGKGDPEVEGT